MVVPTSYTYDEFADYLQFEVLRGSARILGWGDLVEAKAAKQDSPAVTRVRNPDYDFVTDEVLRQMGLSSITDINSSNIMLFRMRGRVEILRKAMQAASALYDYSSPVGITIQKTVIRDSVRRMYDYESQRLDNYLASLNVSTPSVPEESLSASEYIGVTW